MTISAQAAARTNVASCALKMYRELEQMRHVLEKDLLFSAQSDVIQALNKAQAHVATIHDAMGL